MVLSTFSSGLRRLLEPCVGWKHKKYCHFESLPDDVVVNILIRLPADCVVECCRRVCKRWHQLTSTSHFRALHLRMPAPAFLLKRGFNAEFALRTPSLATKKIGTEPFCIDLMRYLLHKGYVKSGVVQSCDGLLLFCLKLQRTDQNSFFSLTSNEKSYWFPYLICNPVTCQEILVPPYNEEAEFPCALFCHILTREYMLLAYTPPQDNEDEYHYHVFTLSTRSWRPLTSVTRFAPSYFYHPPVIVNGSLHWMIPYLHQYPMICTTSIFRFNMITEDFDTIPHPGHEHCSTASLHGVMRILDMEGSLSLCNIGLADIDIWVLVDAINWVQRYKVRIIASDNFNDFPLEGCINVVTIQDGELIFVKYGGGSVFACSLAGGVATKFDQATASLGYGNSFVTYKKSLVTLK